MENKDFRDELYLEDLPKVDKEMLEDIVKNPRSYNFRGMASEKVFSEAIQCFLDNITMAFKKLGAELPPWALHFILCQPKSEFNNIEIENRTKYRDEESWRNGTYVFKNGILAYFVSAPNLQKPNSLSTHYIVRTNVRL